MTFQEKEQVALDDKAVESFKSIPNVVAVSPILEVLGAVINGRIYSPYPHLGGIDPDSMGAFGLK